LTLLLFVLAMAGAWLVGYPPYDAWLDTGWCPLVVALVLATLLFGSGHCGRYLARFSRHPSSCSVAGLRNPW